MSAQTAYAPTLWHEMFATVFNEFINPVLVTMWVGWLAAFTSPIWLPSNATLKDVIRY